MSNINTVKKIFLSTLLIFSGSTFAQWAVIDITNLIQNLYQVAHDAEIEINTLTMKMNQIIQLKHEVQNLKEMSPGAMTAKLAGLENEFRSMERLKSSTQNLRSAVKGENDLMSGMEKMIKVSGLTTEGWIEREKFLVKQEDENAKFLMKSSENSIKAVEEAKVQRDKILQDNNYDEGIRAVAMKTNAMLGNLSTIQSQTLLQLTSDSQSRAVEMKKRDTEERTKKQEAIKITNDRIRYLDSLPKIYK